MAGGPRPPGVLHGGLAARDRLDGRRGDGPRGESTFQQVKGGSGQGAVSVFPPTRFPGPPGEPDLRLSPHPAPSHLTPWARAAIGSVPGVRMTPRYR